MNDAVVYAVAAMFCYGLGDFIYKQSVRAGVRAEHFLAAQAWWYCPLIIVYALAVHALVAVRAALWGSLAGLFVFIGLFYFIRSLAIGSVSINASIFRLNFLITAILAIVLLGEPLTARKICGLTLGLVGTWLLLGSNDLRGGAPAGAQRRSIVQVLAAMVAFGTGNFFHAVGLRRGVPPETLLVAQAIVFMPLATAVVYWTDRKLPPPPMAFRCGGIAAILLLGAFVFLLHAVAKGDASILVPIAQMGFIVTALLGITLLGETLTVRKAIGLGAALAALAVLASS